MVLGCDIGTSFTKAVLFEDGEYRCEASVPTEANPDGALQRVIEKVCSLGGIEEDGRDNDFYRSLTEP
jgi:sugar (pentulose or hexulose) kinase